MESVNQEALCVEDYPFPEHIRNVSKDSLESLFEKIRNRFSEEEVESFPGGVHGYLIYSLLAQEAEGSAQEIDYEESAAQYGSIYSYFYGRGLMYVHDRLLAVYEKIRT